MHENSGETVQIRKVFYSRARQSAEVTRTRQGERIKAENPRNQSPGRFKKPEANSRKKQLERVYIHGRGRRGKHRSVCRAGPTAIPLMWMNNPHKGDLITSDSCINPLNVCWINDTCTSAVNSVQPSDKRSKSTFSCLSL